MNRMTNDYHDFDDDNTNRGISEYNISQPLESECSEERSKAMFVVLTDDGQLVLYSMTKLKEKKTICILDTVQSINDKLKSLQIFYRFLTLKEFI